MQAQHTCTRPSMKRRRAPHGAWLSGALIVLMLPAIACGLQQDTGTTSSTDNNTPTAVESPSPADTASPSEQSTATPTSKGNTPTPAPTKPGAPAFAIAGVTLSVSPTTVSGACSTSTSFTFTGKITAPAGTTGGSVTYRWYYSDGTSSSNKSTSFGAGVTSKTVTEKWSLGPAQGNGSTYWGQLKTTAPNAKSSSQASFKFTCKFGVAKVEVSVSPTSFNMCKLTPQDFTFTGGVFVNPAAGSNTIMYHWERTDGATTPSTTITFPSGVIYDEVSTTWTLSYNAPSGDYGMRMVVTRINSTLLLVPIKSNMATFHKGICA